ncbi:MAG: hypothetical protein ACYC6N_12790 [Pirellulaceae bacterium]
MLNVFIASLAPYGKEIGHFEQTDICPEIHDRTQRSTHGLDG